MTNATKASPSPYDLLKKTQEARAKLFFQPLIDEVYHDMTIVAESGKFSIDLKMDATVDIIEQVITHLRNEGFSVSEQGILVRVGWADAQPTFSQR